MNIVIFGPPGAGKGTQAVMLSNTLRVPHISTGDLFRSNVAEQSPLGLEAARYLDGGDLVPSALTTAMVRARLAEPDARSGFILDGYPRTGEQADALNVILGEHNAALDVALAFEVDTATVVARMKARGRDDDTADVISNRLDVYDTETRPLHAFYAAHDLLVKIDAEGDVDDVYSRALHACRHARPGARSPSSD